MRASTSDEYELASSITEELSDEELTHQPGNRAISLA